MTHRGKKIPVEQKSYFQVRRSLSIGTAGAGRSLFRATANPKSRFDKCALFWDSENKVIASNSTYTDPAFLHPANLSTGNFRFHPRT